jgi:hypothetical protein
MSKSVERVSRATHGSVRTFTRRGTTAIAFVGVCSGIAAGAVGAVLTLAWGMSAAIDGGADAAVRS